MENFATITSRMLEVFFLSVVSLFAHRTIAAQSHPNFIVILADDLGCRDAAALPVPEDAHAIL